MKFIETKLDVQSKGTLHTLHAPSKMDCFASFKSRNIYGKYDTFRSTKDKWFMHPDEDKSAKSMADKKG